MELELFRGIVPFVAVVEESSFRRAAARLGVSPAAVSKAVATLERELSVSLLTRGARAVTLTREGEAFFEGARAAVKAMAGARATAEASRREPSGELVVSAPFAAAALLPEGLAILRARHPRLSFRVHVSDKLTRFAEEPVDVAVRVGKLSDSALVARRLRGTKIVTVAAPGYLARAGTPRRPAELEDHDALVLVGPTGKVYPWLFRSGAREVRPRLVLDHAPTLVDAAVAGLGVAQIFEHMVQPLVKGARLVSLFPDEDAEGPEVHAVCAPGRRATPRVRAAFEAFTTAFAG